MDAPALCPHFRRVVMVFCDAAPVRKLVAEDQLVELGPCGTEDHRCCPLLAEDRDGDPDDAEKEERCSN